MQPFCIMYVCMQYNQKSMRFLSKIQRNRKQTSSGAHIVRLDFGCFLLDGLRVSVSVYLASSSRAGGGQSCFSGRTSRARGESTPERLHGSRSAGGRPMLRRYGTTACLPCRFLGQSENAVGRGVVMRRDRNQGSDVRHATVGFPRGDGLLYYANRLAKLLLRFAMGFPKSLDACSNVHICSLSSN